MVIFYHVCTGNTQYSRIETFPGNIFNLIKRKVSDLIIYERYNKRDSGGDLYNYLLFSLPQYYKLGDHIENVCIFCKESNKNQDGKFSFNVFLYH